MRGKRLERGLRLLARRMQEEGLPAVYQDGVLTLRGEEGVLRLTARECLARGLDPWRLARAFGLEARREEGR